MPGDPDSKLFLTPSGYISRRRRGGVRSDFGCAEECRLEVSVGNKKADDTLVIPIYEGRRPVPPLGLMCFSLINSRETNAQASVGPDCRHADADK